jgi:hypothetical protein
MNYFSLDQQQKYFDVLVTPLTIKGYNSRLREKRNFSFFHEPTQLPAGWRDDWRAETLGVGLLVNGRAASSGRACAQEKK